jgi:uncharacterized protein (DUF58 family)
MSRWIDRFLQSERTYIIPNGTGLAFGALFFSLLFIGAALNRPLIQLIGFMIAIPYLSTMVQSNANLKDLKLRVPQDPLGMAGSTVEIRVLVEQTGKDPARRVFVRVCGAGSPSEQKIERILPGESFEIRISAGSFQRGVHLLPDIEVSSAFPISMFHTWKKFRSGARAWVHPVPSGGLPWPRSGLTRDDSTLEYREHRTVVPGDSPSRIDWKRFARDHQRLIKVYEADPENRVSLRWDEVRHLGLEPALAQMTRWMLDCVRTGVDATIEAPFANGPVTQQSIDSHLRAMAGYGENG